MDNLNPNLLKFFSEHFSTEDVVIVAPLNWGIGHATRCIPLIQQLKSICKEVIIASDGTGLDVLIKEFPDLQHEELPSYNIRYYLKSIFLNILLMIPSLLRAIWSEKKSASILVKKYKATIILSDNRLGFKCQDVKNIYMTHQLSILHKNPVISYCGSRIHQWWIKNFDICIIPDYIDDRSLCPKLTGAIGIKKIFIGPLTRIKRKNLPFKWDICVMLSGPEPQRSILEKKLKKQVIGLTQYKVIFITGNHALYEENELPARITKVGLITTCEIEEILNSSRLLISRSGYSTIMDIEKLDLHAIFIPTPGQTEQEYLGQFCSLKFKYACLPQNNINLLPEIIKKQFDKINISQK